MISKLLVLAAICTTVPLGSILAHDVLNDISKIGRQIFQSSAVPGVTVRECSCQEQTACIEEIRVQARNCLDSCWNRLQSVTSNPAALRQCVSNQSPLITEFLGCIGKNLHSCWPNKNGPQIQKQDVMKFVQLSEEKIESSKNALLSNPAIKPIKNLLNSAIDFAHCVKECLMQRNSAGFCFDRFGCQPLMNEDQARKSLKKCMKTVNWKSRASEFCECSLKAGIQELKNYCPVLRAMARTVKP